MPCTFETEQALWSKGITRIAGIDEAGRGPLAGPVVAAAVVLLPSFSLVGVDDSKKLPEQFREKLFQVLCDPQGQVLFGVGSATSEEIDRFNILQATYLAMKRALSALPEPPEHLLIDGRPVSVFREPQTAIVGGDAKSLSIAAASIVAKVTRDRMMRSWHKKFPDYGFDRNKGYGTRAHLEKIQTHGPCPIHRKSFAPVTQKTFEFFYL
jgi:ribonuclease HII